MDNIAEAKNTGRYVSLPARTDMADAQIRAELKRRNLFPDGPLADLVKRLQEDDAKKDGFHQILRDYVNNMAGASELIRGTDVVAGGSPAVCAFLGIPKHKYELHSMTLELYFIQTPWDVSDDYKQWVQFLRDEEGYSSRRELGVGIMERGESEGHRRITLTACVDVRNALQSAIRSASCAADAVVCGYGYAVCPFKSILMEGQNPVFHNESFERRGKAYEAICKLLPIPLPLVYINETGKREPYYKENILLLKRDRTIGDEEFDVKRFDVDGRGLPQCKYTLVDKVAFTGDRYYYLQSF
jgi:hypothetical protein